VRICSTGRAIRRLIRTAAIPPAARLSTMPRNTAVNRPLSRLRRKAFMASGVEMVAGKSGPIGVKVWMIRAKVVTLMTSMNT
jgi:hypothetical protein